MPDVLRPIIGRIAGSLVGAVAAWLVGRYGISVDPDTQAQLTDGIITLMLFVFGVVYSLVHKAVSSKVNPGDTATKKLALRSKAQQHNAA